MPDDIYKYRQLMLYKSIYEDVYKSYKKKEQVYFEHELKNIIKNHESVDSKNYYMLKISNNWTNKIVQSLSAIIKEIQDNRP